jgi:hypothetical protein
MVVANLWPKKVGKWPFLDNKSGQRKMKKFAKNADFGPFLAHFRPFLGYF